MEWIPVNDTKLGKERGARSAGRLFGIAGIERKRVRSKDAQFDTTYVEARAKDLTLQDIANLKGSHIAVRNEDGTKTFIIPQTPNTPGTALTRAIQFIKNQEPSLEAQLIEVCEQQDKLINELRDEVRQLRQHIANLQHRNGLGDRARKALSAARQTLRDAGSGE